MRVRWLLLHGSPRVARRIPSRPRTAPRGLGVPPAPELPPHGPLPPAEPLQKSSTSYSGEKYGKNWNIFFSSFISLEAEPKVPALLEVSITSDRCVSHSATVPFSSGSLPEFMLTQV